ncbi:MAG: hypothetical protein NTU41_15300, partial [Chloroflexi bacterium]|nr:hypothetical protein [Chloroflexota bacterium]
MEQQDVSLGEAALSFLTSLPSEEGQDKQQEINRFVVWYGKGRPVSRIAPSEIGTYAEWVASSTAEAAKRLEPVKSFLTYLRKENLVVANLASHLRA